MDRVADRHPLRILVVEDNIANQKLMVRLLGLMGYRPKIAGNGLEAIAALEAETFDLVFMDVQMPELDGLEATRRIRQRWPSAAGPRIVAMTASVMVGARELCLAAGMDDYMSKPIRVEELTAAVEATPAPRDPGAASIQPGVLDRHALGKLVEMVGRDPEFVDELFDHYLAEGPQQIAAARAALDAGDAAGVGQAAHALHGTSLNLGGARVAGIARQIEERGVAGNLDGVDRLLADLEAARLELADALEHERARRWSEA